MWAGTLCPLLSSTRNIAFGSASTTVPSISITPSFFGMSSAFSARVVWNQLPSTREPPRLPDDWRTVRVDLVSPPGALSRARVANRVRGVCRAAKGATKRTHVGPTHQSTGKDSQPLIERRSAAAEGHPELLEPRPAAVEGGEHPGAAVGEREGVLEVGRQRTVVGLDGPVVVEHVGLRGPGHHHRLAGQRHSLDQPGPLPGPAVVRHGRGLVHRRADAVAGVVLDDAVAAPAADVLLDGVRDVG